MIEVRLASVSGDPTRPNEDCFVAVPGLVAVFDGVTTPQGLDTGCRHGPAWYTRRLAANLVAGHVTAPDACLTDLVADTIRTVRDEHGTTCDLDHPGTPQSTLAVVRIGKSRAEYLVLCDSTVVLDQNGQVRAITDLRLRDSAGAPRRAMSTASGIGSVEQIERIRALTLDKRERANRPGGYWIAAADPTAAYHALRGTAPLTGSERLTRAALLTDGSSCVVDQYALIDWSGMLDYLHSHGPRHVIELARAAERADPHGYDRPRFKAHDDATIAYCVLVREVSA